MPAWHFLPSLSAWKSDTYNISEALEIQAPSPFTCYEGHCNDWHLRDVAHAGDSIRTGCMNINVVLTSSAALGWTEAPLTGPGQKPESACLFIMQQNPGGLRDTLWDSARCINVYFTTTVRVTGRAGLTLRLVAFWTTLLMSSVKKTTHTILAPAANTVKSIWASGLSGPQ